MDNSSQPSISKILLDLSEYERLRHIEAKYIELNSKHNDKLSKLSDAKDEQIGSGLDEIGLIPLSATPIETSTTSIVQDNQGLIHYDSSIKKNDLNSNFDEIKLLALISKNSVKPAKFILSEIDKRGSELTWNSSGTIFINQIAIPQSNIFLLFPLLLKKKLSNILDLMSWFKNYGTWDLEI